MPRSPDEFLRFSRRSRHARLDDEQPAEKTSFIPLIHAPGDVRFEELDDPKLIHPTDAIIRTAVTCVCGSDLWPYRGAEPIEGPHPMGHEYVGVVDRSGVSSPR